jgi:antitoxin component YwqK of YwqJK toxin-antitoxin module
MEMTAREQFNSTCQFNLFRWENLALTLVFGPLFSLGQTEIKQEHAQNGNLIAEVAYLDGVRNGACKYFSEDGTPYTEMIFSDDQLNGPFKSYYGNGKVEWEGAFKNGKKDGLWKNYREDGIIQLSGKYGENDDEPWTHYDENGIAIAPEDVPKSPDFWSAHCRTAY